MEFHLGAAITGFVLLAVCMVPFILMYNARIKRETNMLKALTNLAQEHNCQITNHEFCSNFVIGLDEPKNFIFFFKQNKDGEVKQYANLATVQQCQAIKKTRSVATGNENVSVTERIELSFTPADKSKTELKFELYDLAESMQLNGELQLAEKWANLISQRLKNKR